MWGSWCVVDIERERERYECECECVGRERAFTTLREQKSIR
jgi:hypothetical protein